MTHMSWIYRLIILGAALLLLFPFEGWGSLALTINLAGLIIAAIILAINYQSRKKSNIDHVSSIT